MDFSNLLRDAQWYIVEKLDAPSRASLALSSRENYASFFDPDLFGNRLFANSIKLNYSNMAHYCRDVLKCPTEVALEDVIDEDATFDVLCLVAELLPSAKFSRRFARALGFAMNPDLFEKNRDFVLECIGSDDLLKLQFSNGAAVGGFIENLLKLCPDLFPLHSSSLLSGQTFVNDQLDSLKFLWRREFLPEVETNPSDSRYFEEDFVSTREVLHNMYFTWLKGGTKILSWFIDGIKNSTRSDKSTILKGAIMNERTFASFGRFGNIAGLKMALSLSPELHGVNTELMNQFLQNALLSAVSHHQMDFVKFIFEQNLLQTSNKAYLFHLCSERMIKPGKWLSMFRFLFDRLGGLSLSPNLLLDPFLVINDVEVQNYLYGLGFRLKGPDSPLLFYTRCLTGRVDAKKKARVFRVHRSILMWLNEKGFKLSSPQALEFLCVDSIFAKNLMMECIKELRDPMVLMDAFEIFGDNFILQCDLNCIDFIDKYLKAKLNVIDHVSRASLLDLRALLLAAN
jgi:hypothetical protein